MEEVRRGNLHTASSVAELMGQLNAEDELDSPVQAGLQETAIRPTLSQRT
jgi:hypothetical protein